jgi:outer membrane protein assembly factor BamB/orotate phosphoribosyltransferase
MLARVYAIMRSMQAREIPTDILLKQLKETIRTEVIVREPEHTIINPDGEHGAWLFDFRRIFLQPKHIDVIAELFWRTHEHLYPFQVGGQEAAAIPLVAAIVMRGIERGTPVNGFFIRKTRKKTGLQLLIEGTLTNEKIVLVDDLINGGGTLLRQIQTLEDKHMQVAGCFVVTRFRDEKEYSFITQKNIPLFSLFSLEDFEMSLGNVNRNRFPITRPSGFREIWRFKSPNPSFFHVIPKSAPAIDDEHVYFGSDSGIFWALDQVDGSMAWKQKIWRSTKGKSIFSSPLLYKGTVYFGAYDGVLYALDAKTGTERWKLYEADWIGASPTIAPRHNLIFIGLEYGLFRRQGGIAAVDATTGEIRWSYDIPELVHCSPAYDEQSDTVIIGSNGSGVYIFEAANGALRHHLLIESEVKDCFVFDPHSNLVAFGAFDGKLYAVDKKSGTVLYTFQTEGPLYSTPVIFKDNIYIASNDKRIYCLDVKTGEKKWQFETGGRILCRPRIIDDHLYIGSNDGYLYELDPIAGTMTDFFFAKERITSPIIKNKDSNRWFLLTNANELLCLEKEV